MFCRIVGFCKTYRLVSVQANKYCFSSLVPDKPISVKKCVQASDAASRIDRGTVALLEQLSLVDFGNEKGIKIVEEAIQFADQLLAVDTDQVEPLTSVLEDRFYYILCIIYFMKHPSFFSLYFFFLVRIKIHNLLLWLKLYRCVS